MAETSHEVSAIFCIYLKSATYLVSWDFACKTTKIHFIVHIPCITETS